MIKTLIFDFGDVFINLDKKATFNGLKALGLSSFTDEMININKDYEVGLISTDKFIASYLDWIPHSNKSELKDIWNSILLDFPEYRLNFLKDLKDLGKYKLILLSNTNELHISWIEDQVPFYNEFKQQFDQFYLSHEIHLRKPNANIYEFVLEKNQLIPEECLFIDDTVENTTAAAKLGIKTWNIHPELHDIVQLFEHCKELH